MQTPRCLFFALAIVVGFTGAAYAVQDTATIASQRVPADSALIIARAQLATMQEYHEDLLDTVYWALGGTFVLVGLLVGFGWFANFRVYERDKEALREDVADRVRQMSADAQAAIEQRMKAVLSDVEKAVASAVKPQISLLDERLLSMEFDSMRLELEQRKKSGSPSMAATAALRLLQWTISNRRFHQAGDVLADILSLLQEGGKFTAYEMASLAEALEKLPSSFLILREKVQRAVTDSEIH